VVSHFLGDIGETPTGQGIEPEGWWH